MIKSLACAVLVLLSLPWRHVEAHEDFAALPAEEGRLLRQAARLLEDEAEWTRAEGADRGGALVLRLVALLADVSTEHVETFLPRLAERPAVSVPRILAATRLVRVAPDRPRAAELAWQLTSVDAHEVDAAMAGIAAAYWDYEWVQWVTQLARSRNPAHQWAAVLTIVRICSLSDAHDARTERRLASVLRILVASHHRAVASVALVFGGQCHGRPFLDVIAGAAGDERRRLLPQYMAEVLVPNARAVAEESLLGLVAVDTGREMLRQVLGEGRIGRRPLFGSGWVDGEYSQFASEYESQVRSDRLHSQEIEFRYGVERDLKFGDRSCVMRVDASTVAVEGWMGSWTLNWTIGTVDTPDLMTARTQVVLPMSMEYSVTAAGAWRLTFVRYVPDGVVLRVTARSRP